MKKNRFGATLATEMHRRIDAKPVAPEGRTATMDEIGRQRVFHADIKDFSSWRFLSRLELAKLEASFEPRKRIYPTPLDVALIKEAAALHNVIYQKSDRETRLSICEVLTRTASDLDLALKFGQSVMAVLVRQRLASLVEKMRGLVEKAELALVETLVEQGDDAFWTALQSYPLGQRGPQLKQMVRERVSSTELYTIADVEAWIDRRSAVEAGLTWLKGLPGFHNLRGFIPWELKQQEQEFWERDRLARRTPKAQAPLKAGRRL